MKLIDTFMFYDEEVVLDVRLHELNKYVEKFVITESTYSHNGKKRNLLFDIKKFLKFKDKIKYIVVDKQPDDIDDLADTDTEDKRNSKLIMNAVKRENYQRNCIKEGLLNINDNDLIMVSDVDEIPNLENVDFDSIKNKLIFFEQKNFYYKFNLYLKNYIWHGTKACKFKYFKNPQWLRNIKSKKYPFYRLDIIFSEKKFYNISFIKNGGWHFSYLKDAQGIENKLKSYLHHREYELEPLGHDKIEQMIKSKIPVYNLKADMKTSKFQSNFKLEQLENKQLPNYIRNNLDLFSEWFI